MTKYRVGAEISLFFDIEADSDDEASDKALEAVEKRFLKEEWDLNDINVFENDFSES